jgi:uncharacterized membrane protein
VSDTGRHRRRRTDPPTPGRGQPLIRHAPPPEPRTVGDLVDDLMGPPPGAGGPGQHAGGRVPGPFREPGRRPEPDRPPGPAPSAQYGRDSPLAERRPEDGRPSPRPRPPTTALQPAATDPHGPAEVVSGAPIAPRNGRPRIPAEPAPAATGHGHGHSPASPAGRRVRVLIAALLIPCGLATLVGLVLLWPRGETPAPTQPPQQLLHAQVNAAARADCTPGSGDGGCTGLTLRLADGPVAGRDLVQLVPVEPSTPRFAVGDQIVLAWSGGDPLDAGSYQVVDFQRTGPLIWLAAAFAVAVLILGRWRGLAALVALGLSFVVLALFVLPAVLAGSDPLAVAVVGSCLIMFLVLYLTHGFSARTSTAVLGTLVSLALIAGLSALFSGLARLTGLDDTTASLIATLGTPVDARGLLLAGVLIGALGVLDDVTVTQTSAVWELRRANPALGAGALFGAGMRIGRDHVSSAVNTLVLAYAGASLPLMLLFTVSAQNLGQVLTTQDVATEIVRTMVGSIGLVASVPITTGLAALVASRERPDDR